MTTLKGHFDGTSIVLDEPAELAVGQAVQIIVEPAESTTDDEPPKRKSLLGFGEGKFKFTFRDDFDEPLDEFADYR